MRSCRTRENAHLISIRQGAVRAVALLYRVGQKSIQRSLHITSSNTMSDFQNSFTVTFSLKFAIPLLLNIPPHLKHVATLPCEIQYLCHQTIVRPQSVKCVTSFRFRKLKYRPNEYFQHSQSMLMVRQLAYHLALRMLPATHQDSAMESSFFSKIATARRTCYSFMT